MRDQSNRGHPYRDLLIAKITPQIALLITVFSKTKFDKIGQPVDKLPIINQSYKILGFVQKLFNQ